MMESCLSHSPRYRNRLQQVLNSLRTSGHLSHQHATRMTCVLCTCTDRSSLNSFWKDATKLSLLVNDAIENVRHQLESLRHSSTLSANCVSQIYAILDSAKISGTPITSLGVTKFIIALDQLFDYQLDLFEATREHFGEKKYRAYPITLPPQYVGLLIGKHGQNLAKVRQLSGCAINAERHRDGRVQDTVIMNIAGVPDGIHRACELLEKEALEIIRKRAIHEEKVRQHDKIRDKIRIERLLERGKDMPTRGVIEDVKNNNRKEYERQQYVRHKLMDEDGLTLSHNRKRNGTKTKGHKLLSEGSKCLNCGVPFKGHNLSMPCKYHSGYVVNRKWTCCDHETLDDGLTTEDHQTTGCSSSIHNFRPTQRRSGKANLNSDMESSSTLTKEGKDTLLDVKRKTRKYRH